MSVVCDGQTEKELRKVWMEQKMMPEWRRAEVPLRNLRNFELIFEVVRTRDVSGGAALDDLQFINCARSEYTHTLNFMCIASYIIVSQFSGFELSLLLDLIYRAH